MTPLTLPLVLFILTVGVLAGIFFGMVWVAYVLDREWWL